MIQSKAFLLFLGFPIPKEIRLTHSNYERVGDDQSELYHGNLLTNHQTLTLESLSDIANDILLRDHDILKTDHPRIRTTLTWILPSHFLSQSIPSLGGKEGGRKEGREDTHPC